MDGLLSFTQQVLDPIGVWVGLVISIPVFWTWWSLTWGKDRQIKIWLKKAKQGAGSNPAVLIVDLLANTEMKPQVIQYLKKCGITISDDRMEVIDRKADIAPDDMPQIAKEVYQAVGKMNYMAADVVHVFFGGPGCVGLLLGAELANLPCQVHFHQASRGQGYQDFGPIRYPHI